MIERIAKQIRESVSHQALPMYSDCGTDINSEAMRAFTNHAFGEGIQRRGEQANAVIAYFPKILLKQGALYNMDLLENAPADETNSINAIKIRDAIDNKLTGFVQNIPSHKLREKQEYTGRIERLKEETTVIGVDIPCRLLLCGEDLDGLLYFQITHVGVGRKVIYISNRFLSEMDVDNPRDMMELATILNHDQIEIDYYHKLLRQSRIFWWLKDKVESYDEELKAHDQAMHDDPFLVYNGIFDRVQDIMSDPEEYTRTIQERELEEASRQIEQQHESIDNFLRDNPDDNYQLRTYYYILAKLYVKMAYLHKMWYRRKEAVSNFKDAIANLAAIKRIDHGLLPIKLELEIIHLYAKEKMPGELLEEIKRLLTCQFCPDMTETEQILFNRYMINNFPKFKSNILMVLERIKRKTTSDRLELEIKEAMDKIRKMSFMELSKT